MNARKKLVAGFTKTMGLSRHAATHTAQKNFQEMDEDSQHFIEMTKEKVKEYDPCDITNMDQSPILYSYHSSRTLEMKGKKTIHIHASTAVTKRVTLAITVDASAKMLPPILIFKGATNGQITYCEFGTYPDHGHYGCQKKAWMDEEMMYNWIDFVLILWRNTTSPGVLPLLILGTYLVHMLGMGVN
jgi:hypothetical protein